MTWPADRKAVDKDGKWLDPWLGQLQKLKPLLAYTPAQFAALQQLIAAYIESQQDDGETDPGTAINLALPIDNEPLFSEDWLISFKNNVQAGRRVPMARFATRSLISSTALAGVSDVTISLPSGFADIEMRIKALSTSSNTIPALEYSEDSGATFLNQPGAVMTRTTIANSTVSQAGMLPANIAAANSAWAVELVRDYSSFTTKLANLEGSYSGEFIYRGVNIQSTAPLNAARFSVPAGTFDAGSVDLWGIP